MVRTKLNSIQRMEVTYGRISQGEILETVLQSDIEKIKLTMSAIDHDAFELAVETLLKARKIYVIGIRSCAPLAHFLSFYLNLICDDVTAVSTNSSSEIFEQLIRIGEDDVIIGISFPRYSMRDPEGPGVCQQPQGQGDYADRQHSFADESVFFLQPDRKKRYGVHCGLPGGALSVVNALVVALCMKKQDEVITRLRRWRRSGTSIRCTAKTKLTW